MKYHPYLSFMCENCTILRILVLSANTKYTLNMYCTVHNNVLIFPYFHVIS